jgi:hypothetical protein
MSRTHGYLDEPFEGFGENAGIEMLKVLNNVLKNLGKKRQSYSLDVCCG